MNAKLYIDKNVPFMALEPQTLSDGSVVWDLFFPDCGRERVIHCTTEKTANAAFMMIAEAIKTASGERPLIL